MVKAGDSWMELVASWVMSVNSWPTVRQEPKEFQFLFCGLESP
jgi:hypothetical protein